MKERESCCARGGNTALQLRAWFRSNNVAAQKQPPREFFPTQCGTTQCGTTLRVVKRHAMPFHTASSHMAWNGENPWLSAILRYSLGVEVNYQVCNKQYCLPPRTTRKSVALTPRQ